MGQWDRHCRPLVFTFVEFPTPSFLIFELGVCWPLNLNLREMPQIRLSVCCGLCVILAVKLQYYITPNPCYKTQWLLWMYLLNSKYCLTLKHFAVSEVVETFPVWRLCRSSRQYLDESECPSLCIHSLDSRVFIYDSVGTAFYPGISRSDESF